MFAALVDDSSSSINNDLPENILLRMARNAEEELAHMNDRKEIW